MMIKSNLMVAAFLALAVVSCEEAIEPVNPVEDVAVNFYNASDYLTYVNAQTYYIFIDRDAIDTVAYPRFAGFFSPQQQDFPSYQDPYGFVHYVQLTTDKHRFIFTDGLREEAKDTTMQFHPGTRNTVYIADRPGTGKVDYSVFAFEEDLSATPGVIKLRLIHLSPDADSLGCYIDSLVTTSDTSFFARKYLTKKQTPLVYGKATAYLELDTAQASNKKINLHFISVRDSANDLALNRIDVASATGHSFVAVVQGFVNPTTRRKLANDGSVIQYTVSPNLRIKTRQTH